MPCNEAGAVRSEKVSIIILEKILHIIEKKIIIKTSPFFYE